MGSISGGDDVQDPELCAAEAGNAAAGPNVEDDGYENRVVVRPVPLEDREEGTEGSNQQQSSAAAAAAAAAAHQPPAPSPTEAQDLALSQYLDDLDHEEYHQQQTARGRNGGSTSCPWCTGAIGVGGGPSSWPGIHQQQYYFHLRHHLPRGRGSAGGSGDDRQPHESNRSAPHDQAPCFYCDETDVGISVGAGAGAGAERANEEDPTPSEGEEEVHDEKRPEDSAQVDVDADDDEPTQKDHRAHDQEPILTESKKRTTIVTLSGGGISTIIRAGSVGMGYAANEEVEGASNDKGSAGEDAGAFTRSTVGATAPSVTTDTRKGEGNGGDLTDPQRRERQQANLAMQLGRTACDDGGSGGIGKDDNKVAAVGEQGNKDETTDETVAAEGPTEVTKALAQDRGCALSSTPVSPAGTGGASATAPANAALQSAKNEIDKLRSENERLRAEIATLGGAAAASTNNGQETSQQTSSSIPASNTGRQCVRSSKVECLSVGPSYGSGVLSCDHLLHGTAAELQGQSVRMTMRNGQVLGGQFHALNLDDSSLPKQQRNTFVLVLAQDQQEKKNPPRVFISMEKARSIDVVSDNIQIGNIFSTKEWSKVCVQNKRKRKRKSLTRKASSATNRANSSIGVVGEGSTKAALQESKRLHLAQEELKRREDGRHRAERARVEANRQALIQVWKQSEEMEEKQKKEPSASTTRLVLEEDDDFAAPLLEDSESEHEEIEQGGCQHPHLAQQGIIPQENKRQCLAKERIDSNKEIPETVRTECAAKVPAVAEEQRDAEGKEATQLLVLPRNSSSTVSQASRTKSISAKSSKRRRKGSPMSHAFILKAALEKAKQVEHFDEENGDGDDGEPSEDAAAQIAAAARHAVDTLGLSADDAVQEVLRTVEVVPRSIATVAVNSYLRSIQSAKKQSKEDSKYKTEREEGIDNISDSSHTASVTDQHHQLGEGWKVETASTIISSTGAPPPAQIAATDDPFAIAAALASALIAPPPAPTVTENITHYISPGGYRFASIAEVNSFKDCIFRSNASEKCAYDLFLSSKISGPTIINNERNVDDLLHSGDKSLGSKEQITPQEQETPKEPAISPNMASQDQSGQRNASTIARPSPYTGARCCSVDGCPKQSQGAKNEYMCRNHWNRSKNEDHSAAGSPQSPRKEDKENDKLKQTERKRLEARRIAAAIVNREREAIRQAKERKLIEAKRIAADLVEKERLEDEQKKVKAARVMTEIFERKKTNDEGAYVATVAEKAEQERLAACRAEAEKAQLELVALQEAEEERLAAATTSTLGEVKAISKDIIGNDEEVGVKESPNASPRKRSRRGPTPARTTSTKAGSAGSTGTKPIVSLESKGHRGGRASSATRSSSKEKISTADASFSGRDTAILSTSTKRSKDSDGDDHSGLSKFPIGTVILKEFEGTPYPGTITSYDPIEKFFKVRYVDGDEEEMTCFEVQQHLLHAKPNAQGVIISGGIVRIAKT